MSWKEEMKEAIVLYVVEQGDLVREDSTEPGHGRGTYHMYQDYAKDYSDFGLAMHVNECGLDLPKSTYVDMDWYEFDGTFAEQPWGHREGTDAVVHCRCGKVAGRHWRYEGGLAALIKGVTS